MCVLLVLSYMRFVSDVIHIRIHQENHLWFLLLFKWFILHCGTVGNWKWTSREFSDPFLCIICTLLISLTFFHIWPQGFSLALFAYEKALSAYKALLVYDCRKYHMPSPIVSSSPSINFHIWLFSMIRFVFSEGTVYMQLTTPSWFTVQKHFFDIELAVPTAEPRNIRIVSVLI